MSKYESESESLSESSTSEESYESENLPEDDKEAIDVIYEGLPGLMLIIAKKYRGKTYLLKWVMEELVKRKAFDWGYIVSATAKATKEWNIIPEAFIRNKWDPEEFMKIYDFQMEKKEQDKPLKCFIIMDDVIGTVNLRDEVVSKFVTTARHIGISLFMNMQKMTDAVPLVIRNNAEWVIVFKQDNRKVYESIWEEWAQDFSDGSRETFITYCNQHLLNYTALFINLREDNPDDKYYLIKAPPVDKDDEGFFFEFTDDKAPQLDEPEPDNKPLMPVPKQSKAELPNFLTPQDRSILNNPARKK